MLKSRSCLAVAARLRALFRKELEAQLAAKK